MRPSLFVGVAHVAADVLFATSFCQIDLFLPFRIARPLLRRSLIVAVWATYPMNVLLAFLVIFSNGHAAGIALVVMTLLELMVNGHTLVEDKAFTFPV